MQTPGILNALRLGLQPELKLKSGDIVYVNVVKRLIGDKWAVSIGGKVYPAFSKTSLYPGEKLKVLVEKTGHSLILKIITETEKKVLLETPARQTEDKEPLSRYIVTSLLKSNMSIAPETVEYFRTLLNKYKKEDLKFIRSLIILFAKSIAPEWEVTAIQELVGLLNYEDTNTGGHKKNKKKKSSLQPQTGEPVDCEYIKKELKRQIQTAAVQDHPLHLFNHLREDGPAWLVIPFEFRQGEFDCHGTIKLLYESFQKKILKLLLAVNLQNEKKWCFAFYPQKDKLKLNIYCEQEKDKDYVQKEKKILAGKLEKYNVKIDDNIYDLEESDGFGAEEGDFTAQSRGFFTGIDISL